MVNDTDVLPISPISITFIPFSCKVPDMEFSEFGSGDEGTGDGGGKQTIRRPTQ